MIPAVEFRQVTRSYPSAGAGPIDALHPTDFTIEPGQTIAIVGRSGSGKSTVIHLCAGIDLPTSGRVSVQGQALADLNETDRTRIRRDTIGLVFQFFHLLPHLNVHDNIALPLLIAGRRWKTVTPRVTTLLHAVGLAHRSADPVTGLSGGEMQRVAIARALVHDPAIVLADEPTGNLDDRTGNDIMDLMLGLTRDRGNTLVYVTHSTDLAARADETWTLNSGVLSIP